MILTNVSHLQRHLLLIDELVICVDHKSKFLDRLSLIQLLDLSQEFNETLHCEWCVRTEGFICHSHIKIELDTLECDSVIALCLLT